MWKYWLSPNITINGLLWLVGIAMEIGDWTSHFIAYILLGIALLWSICTLIYWSLNKDKINRIYKIKEYYGVIPVLQKMDAHIRYLAKQESKRVIDFKEYEKVSKVTNKDIIQVKEPKPKTIKGLKKTTKKLEVIIDKKIKDEIFTIRDGVEKLEPISSYLDAKGFGLKQQKEIDKKYMRLVSQLQKYLNLPLGSEINDLIDLHVRYSETGANMLLGNIRTLQVKIENTNIGFTDVISTQMQIITEQTENNMKDITSRIRARIVDCIRELETKVQQTSSQKE
jgi:hypothetical protein